MVSGRVRVGDNCLLLPAEQRLDIYVAIAMWP